MTKHYIRGATKKNRSSNVNKNAKANTSQFNIVTLVIGCIVGSLVTWLAVYSFSNSQLPQQTKDVKSKVKIIATPERQLAPEPRFEFYSELSKNSNESDIKSSKPNPPPTNSFPKESLKTRTKAINSYLVQAGSFKNKNDADALRATLALYGLEAKIEFANLSNGEKLNRVILGPFKAEKKARALQQLLKSYEINSVLVVKYAEVERG